MRYELRLTAFDMLDQVHVHMALYADLEEPGRPTEPVLARTTTVPGSGTPGSREWSQEALIAMLEAL